MNNKLSLIVNFVGVDKMSGALRNIVGLGRKGSQSLRALSADSRKLTRELASVQRELARGSGNVTELVNRERDLERQIARTNTQIDKQKRLAAINADKMAMMRRAEELKSKGQDNVFGGAMLAAPLIVATKQAGEFSSGMVDIQQKAGLADAEADRLANRIIVLAAAAKQMPEDMRSGLDALLAKGMDVTAATKAIGPIGRLATAYKVEIPDAANSTFAALSNLKIAAGDTGKVLDAMAAAGNDGGFEVRDMARYFPSLTAQMQALGEKGVPAVADLSAALQVAMHTAGNADEAGNNVANLLAKINAPATIAAFKKNFGIDLPAAMQKLTDEGHSSLEAIAMLTQKATGGDMKKLGFAFQDQQARMGILALIQNLDEYRNIRKDALTAGGTVDKAFDQRAVRDATVSWRTMMGTLQSTAIILGTHLLPVAAQFMGTASGIAIAVANWAKAHPELASYLAQGAAYLIAFKMGLGAAQYALGSILGPAASVISWARKAAPVFGLLRTAVIFLGKGFVRAGIMMMANPIVLLITAIVVAVGVAAYLIYSHWDKIKAAFWGGVAWVKKTIGALPDWLKTIGSMMMQGLLLAINPMALAGRLLQVAKNGLTAFKNYFGIKSPSRVFMMMGGHLATGLERGIDQNRHAPARAVGRMATGVMAAGAMSLTPVAAAARPGPSQGMAGGSAPIVIHVHAGPGMDVKQLAREVRRELDAAQAQRARSSYSDGH